MASNRPPPAKFALKPSLNDGDGNHIHNRILLDLPAEERGTLFAGDLVFVAQIRGSARGTRKHAPQ